MNAQELLEQCDHALTEVDIELMEWQEAVDFMSFIGQSVPMKLWVDDREVEDATMTPFGGGHMMFVEGRWEDVNGRPDVTVAVPLVRYDNGERFQVGIAQVEGVTGVFHAVLDRKQVKVTNNLPDPESNSFFTEPGEAIPYVQGSLLERLGRKPRPYNASPNLKE